MSSVKRVLVLANSIKKGARCVAGREVMPGAKLIFGDWLRPISDEPEGELMPKHMRVNGGAPVLPLQVVDITVDEAGDSPSHPEDRLVTDDPWTIVDTLTAEVLPDLIEKPTNLWLEPGKAVDRVSPSFVEKNINHQSLYLVRPEKFRIEYWTEDNPFTGRTQKKTRALFTFGATAYNMSFTDPVATSKYCKNYPAQNEAVKEVAPPFGENCVLCVSLTPAFNGNHYKIVATILGLL